MNKHHNPHFEAQAQDFLESVRPLGISHIIYGVCDNVNNIAQFGLQARRGKNFSQLPNSLHHTMSKQGLNWEQCLPLEYCWQQESDCTWSESALWRKRASVRQREIHALWKSEGFGVGVSLPIRTVLDQDTCIGAAVLLFAQHLPEEDFQTLYAQNAKALRCHAENLDRTIRAQCMEVFFPLTKKEHEALKLYRRIGDIARIAQLYKVSPRAIQLRLQKARRKLQVETNTEALNFCRSFDLLSD